MQQQENITNASRAFEVSWLNSSYFETLLPNSPWQNVSDILSPKLAELVKKQFHNEHRKQMIIELVGAQFKRSYLTDEKDNPLIILPPNLNEEQHKKLENEAKSWLQIQINEIALLKKCALTKDQSEENLCSEMRDYLDHTYQIIRTSLERYLYLKQGKITQNEHKADVDDKDFDVKSVRSLNMYQKYTSMNTLRDMMTSRRPPMTAIEEKRSLKKSIGELTSPLSEVIGEALIDILRKDPRRIDFLRNKLIGQQFTCNLRQFFWNDILLRNERKRNALQNDVEGVVRRHFAANVQRGKNDLKLKDPTQTQVSALIENAVIETYSRVTSLQYWLDEHHLRQTMKILNILYTYSRDYEPFYIYWLLPFQITYSQESSKKSEMIYDLAMYLDLFVKNYFSSWQEVFTIAGKVMSDLSIHDLEFHDHLRHICKKNAKINPKDFVNQIIHNEGKRSGMIDTEPDVRKLSRDLLGEPLIFLRKWIGEAFASILHKNTLLYVWDQLFMSLWASIELERITKALLYLLRQKFMQARDYDEMRRVFLEEPCNLYTSDVQSAYMHIKSGAKERDIATFNKRNNEPLNRVNFEDKNVKKYTKNSQDKRDAKTNIFDPIAFKNIRLNLIVPKQGLTSEFDPRKTRVIFNLFYGDTKLDQKNTENIALVKDVKASLQETRTYNVEIVDNIYFDLSEFSAQIDSSSSFNEIFTLIVIKSQTTTYEDIYMGFCKIPLYRPQKIGDKLNTWEVTHGLINRFLHPGVQPFNLNEITDTPKASYKDRLGPNSTITVEIFNPDTDKFLNK